MTALMLLIISQSGGDTVYNLRDFRLPDAGAMSLILGTAGDFYLGKGSASRDSFNSKHSSFSLDGLILGEYKLSLLNEKRFLDLRVSTRPSDYESFYFSIYGGRYEYERDTVSTTDTSFHVGVYPLFGSSTTAGWYINESQWFLGFIDTLHVGTDIWFSDYLNRWMLSLPQFYGNIFAGGGFGKVRNVAPAAMAWQFLDEVGTPDGSDVEALAELLSTRWKYGIRHWYYEKSFYSDAAALLAERGIVPRLTSYQSMRLREIVLGLPSERLYGNRVFLGAGGTIGYWLSGFGLKASIIGGYPISRLLQLNWNGEGTVLSRDFAQYECLAVGGATMSCYIGERWRFSLGIDGYYLYEPYGNSQHDFGFYIPLTSQFFVEDNIKIQTALTYQHQEYRNFESGFSSRGHKLWFQLGLTWHLF